MGNIAPLENADQSRRLVNGKLPRVKVGRGPRGRQGWTCIECKCDGGRLQRVRAGMYELECFNIARLHSARRPGSIHSWPCPNLPQTCPRHSSESAYTVHILHCWLLRGVYASYFLVVFVGISQPSLTIAGKHGTQDRASADSILLASAFRLI